MGYGLPIASVAPICAPVPEIAAIIAGVKALVRMNSRQA